MTWQSQNAGDDIMITVICVAEDLLFFWLLAEIDRAEMLTPEIIVILFTRGLPYVYTVY